MEPTSSRTLGVRWVIVILFLAAAIGSVSLIYPFGRDQGVFAYLAWQCREGATLYRDVFSDKPPLSTATHVLAQSLFGHSMRSIRLLDVLWAGGVAVTVAMIGVRVLRGRGPAVLAAALFLVSYWAQSHWTTAQTDGWMNLPIALAALLVLPGAATGRPVPAPALLLAGAFLGVAFLYKYTAGIFLVWLVALTGVAAGPVRPRALRAGALVAGFCGPVAGTAIWLTASGALPAFWSEHVEWMGSYVGIRESASRIVRFDLFSRLAILFGLGVLGSLGMAARSGWSRLHPTSTAWILATWFAAGGISLLAQGKYFDYHFLPLLPPAALGTAATLDHAFGNAWGRIRPASLQRVLPALVVGALVLLPPYAVRFGNLGRVATGTVPEEVHWSSPAFSGFTFSFRDDLILAQYVDREARTGDRLFVWGFEPLVNFLSRRSTGSRLSFSYPLAAEAGLPELRREFLAAMRDDPPEWFVIQRGDLLPIALGHGKDSHRTIREWGELSVLVGQRYDGVATLGELPGQPPAEAPRFLVARLRAEE